jgi:metal-sulfur cluster biosynthetic enzyme
MADMPDEDGIRMALSRVEDPEAGMNIVDLGLVYAIDVGHDAIRVDITMTSAACPMADAIVDEVRGTIAAMVSPGTPIDVRIVWDPPWTPDRMSGMAKEHFGWTF